MRRLLWAAIIAAGIAAALYFGLYYAVGLEEDAKVTTPDNLPIDPAGRQAALRQALQSEGVSGKAVDTLIGQARLETAAFRSAEFPLSLSPWNRHVGSGKHGDWNGRVCMLGPDGHWKVYDSDEEATKDDPHYAQEHLRCFDSLEQSVRDIKGLLALQLYAEAKAALDAGDPAAYAEAIAEGDGKNGFVGPVGTTKANNYTAGLLGQYRELGIA